VDMESNPLNGTFFAFQQQVVLIVDDNEDNLVLLTFLVEQFGCTCINAQDGQTALELAQTHQPSLIFLDIMLPDVDGMEVASCLKNNPVTSKIAIIAVTAMARAEDKENILSAGCDVCITKPYAVEEIEALLKHYLS
jgi:two-component system cell cycle response regulator DivK